jgi:branched-chain amino acid transport system permease protein
MFIVEVSLVMIFGPDQQWVDVPYSGGAIAIGIVQLPLRMLVPAALSLAAIASLVAIGLVFGLRRATSGRGRGAAGGGGPGPLRRF